MLFHFILINLYFIILIIKFVVSYFVYICFLFFNSKLMMYFSIIFINMFIIKPNKFWNKNYLIQKLTYKYIRNKKFNKFIKNFILQIKINFKKELKFIWKIKSLLFNYINNFVHKILISKFSCSIYHITYIYIIIFLLFLYSKRIILI